MAELRRRTREATIERVVVQADNQFDTRADAIQVELERARLKRIRKSAPIVPLTMCICSLIGFVAVAGYFQTNLLPQAAATQGSVTSPIAEAVETEAEKQTRFNPPETSEPAPSAPVKQSISYWVDLESSGKSWSTLGAAEGLLTFRGNPTRTFYGQGPVPENPQVLWSNTLECSNSQVDGQDKQWCGTGWTGQPAVFKSPQDDTKWWVAIGGYNKKVNFFDPETGDTVFPAFATGDIIKGSVTIDPDNYPLLYTGSRDDFFHIVSLDGDQPIELWSLSAESDKQTYWNNDWDGSALIINDYLFLGGENSRFYIFKLNRGYDQEGKVVVDPEEIFSAPGWDEELLENIDDNELSIENSVAISGNTVYFSNSAGLVQGWNIADLESGVEPQRTFRFWTGDDTDASIVIDDEGALYVASQYQRGNERSDQIGQIIKLDPEAEEPLVWSKQANAGLETGIWATPGLYEDLLVVPTNEGEVLGIDTKTGEERWKLTLGGSLWSSPAIVDGILVQADCKGKIHGYDISDTASDPDKKWELSTGGGCIESTPALWDGKIFVGDRGGKFYGIGE